MKVTKSQAREALAWLRQFGTPEHAAHQVTVQLQAIEPYTDSSLTTIRSMLRNIAERPYQVPALELCAAGKAVERYTDEHGAILYREKVTMSECQECGEMYPLSLTNSTVFCEACVEYLIPSTDDLSPATSS